MKTSLSPNTERGLTLLEIFVILAVISVLALLLMPALHRAKVRAQRISCVSHLKQIGLASRVWEGDHTNLYPTQVSVTNGGTMEFTSGLNEFRHFLVMSNELSTPKILVCPSDGTRIPATNFAFLRNSNISFFVGVDANDPNPQLILAGDRNITNSTPIRNGILELTKNTPAGWTAELHNKVGNVLLSDGSVQRLSRSDLRSAVANTGIFTNRLQMPILDP